MTAKAKQPKVKYRNLKLVAEASFGHVNHDSEVHVSVGSDGTWTVRHCDAMLIMRPADLRRLWAFIGPKVRS